MLNVKSSKVTQLLLSKKPQQLNQQCKLWPNPQINITDFTLKLNLYMKNYQMQLKKEKSLSKTMLNQEPKN